MNPAPSAAEAMTQTTPRGSVLERFAAWVTRSGEALAVNDGERALSYETLDRLSNRIGRDLGERHRRGPHHPVGLFLEHDARVVAAMLGALKARRTFVHLDPALPDAHLARLTRHADLGAVVVSPGTRARAPGVAPSAARLDLEALRPWTAWSPPPPHEAPMALLHTSGSSGAPRAVRAREAALLHNLDAYGATLGLAPTDRLALVTPSSFAPAHSVIFGALLHGASVHPFDVRAHGVDALARWLAAEAITVLHTVPTLFRHLADRLDPEPGLPALRWIKLGGEPVVWSDVDLLASRFASARLCNGLGLTEAGGNLGHFVLAPGSPAGSTPFVPVGPPMPGRAVELLDEHGAPVTDGAPGEITVVSDVLADGYWRDPELTARTYERLPTRPGHRRLRTGDLGAFTDTGALVHLGRIDGRLKVRGMQVRPAEVEAALRAQPEIAEVGAAVEAGAEGNRLVAHVVIRPGHALHRAVLRARLLETLPPHLVPSRWVERAALPRTSSGKLDRRALATVTGSSPALRGATDGTPTTPGVTSVGPVDAVLALAPLWEAVLGVDAAHGTDDFFAQGGDSLRGARLMERIAATFGVQLPVSTLLEHPTLYRLARRVQRGRSARPLSSIRMNENGSKPTWTFLHGDVRHGGLYSRALARQLGPDQPLLVLPPQLHARWPTLPSLRTIARGHVEVLRAAQPSGPYRIAGFCISGLIAHAMAVDLQAAGEVVDRLVVIDSLPGSRWARFVATVLRRLTAAGRVSPFRAVHLLEVIRGPSLDLRHVKWHLRRALSPNPGKARPPRQSRYVWARAAHALERFEGLVHVFLATDHGRRRARLARRWRRAGDRVAFTRLAATHGSLQRGDVSGLARGLSSLAEDPA